MPVLQRDLEQLVANARAIDVLVELAAEKLTFLFDAVDDYLYGQVSGGGYPEGHTNQEHLAALRTAFLEVANYLQEHPARKTGGAFGDRGYVGWQNDEPPETRVTGGSALVENDIEHLRVKRDGDAYFVHLDDFVDLQESPAVFLNGDSWQGKILSEWWEATPLIHLPFIELFRILNSLRGCREASE